jgi:hypothetical protein
LISIIRAIDIKRVLPSTDFTWDYTSTATWTTIELNLFIFVQCLVVLRPLFTQFWPSLFGSNPSREVPSSEDVRDDRASPVRPKSLSASSSEREKTSPAAGVHGGDLEAQRRRPHEEDDDLEDLEVTPSRRRDF